MPVREGTDVNAYNRRHYRVQRARGPAKNQMCVEGGDHPARDWAQIHDTDGESVEHYQPMCSRHHQAYDKKWDEAERAKLSKTLRERGIKPPLATGLKRSEETRRRMSEAQLARYARERDAIR